MPRLSLKKGGRLVFFLGLATTVVLAGFTVAGCANKKAGVPVGDVKIVAEPDQRVFDLFVGLNMAGYDVELGAAMDPVREQVRARLASVDKAEFSAFAGFMSGSTLDALSGIVVKELQGPPSFSTSSTSGIVPDISRAMKVLWNARAGALWDEFKQAHADAAAALVAPSSQAIQDTLAYFHATTSPVATVHVIPNLLGSHGETYTYADKQTKAAYLVTGPADDQRMDTIVHAFAHFILGDTLHKLELKGGLKRFIPVLDKAKSVDYIAKSYPSLKGFVEDSLVRAVTIRVRSSGQDQARLDAEYNRGFVLVPAFWKALEGYQAQDKSLIEVLPSLLSGIDVNAVLQSVEDKPPTGP